MALHFIFQAVLLAVVLGVLMYYGEVKILSILAYESPLLMGHLLIGLAVSVVIAVILLFRTQLGSRARLAILAAAFLFGAYALAMGYFTVIFAALPTYYSFRYWRSDSA